MKLKKGYKIGITAVLLVLLLGVLIYGGFRIYKKFNNNTTEVQVVKEIPEYGYALKDNASKEYQNLFDDLVDTLGAEEVDDEAYAKLVAQMVTSDFYTISNKISKTDIGGTQFILSSYKDNFILEAEETVYKYVEHNIYGDREQKLPEVTETSVTDIRTSTYTYGDYTDDACYVVTVALTYKEDLGYPTEVVVKMLHQDNKLEVFYMK